MKIETSNKGGKYYRKHDESRYYHGPFATILEKDGICAQYIVMGTSQTKWCNKKEKSNFNWYG